MTNPVQCTPKSHRLIHPKHGKPPALPKRAVAAGATAWPSYSGTATLIGTTPDGRCAVYYGESGALPNAQDLLAAAPSIMAINDAIFGIQSGVVNVIVFALGGQTDGTGGADHMGCDFTTGQNIEVDSSYGSSPRVYDLFEAELSECCMNGNLCGESTGEALSRCCANEINSALSDFASGPTWAQGGYNNWVDTTENTDGNYDSIGCGMCFLSWLRGKKGYTLAQIAQVMVKLGDSGTLAGLYTTLSGDAASPWAVFLADVKALPAVVGDDDPFGSAIPVPPVPPSPPPPVPPLPTAFSGVVTSIYLSGALVSTTVTPATGLKELGGGGWTALVALAKWLAKVLGPIAKPIIQGWIATLPLPPNIIAALEAIVAAIPVGATTP